MHAYMLRKQYACYSSSYGTKPLSVFALASLQGHSLVVILHRYPSRIDVRL